MSANMPSTPSVLVPDMRPINSELSIGAERSLAFRHLRGLALECRQEVNVFLVLGHGLLKGLALRLVQYASHGQVHRQGVDGLLVDAEFVMQMRSGRPAGGADVADKLALADGVAFLQACGKSALVRIQRGVATMVLQDDGVSVAILLALEFDGAVSRCMDGCAGGRRIIDAFMTAPAAVHRMLAHAERGTDA